MTAFVAALLVIYILRLQLIWLGTAFFLSIALNPLVVHLTKYMPRKNRALATGSVFLGGLAIFSLLLVMLTPPVVKQTEQLISNIPSYTNQLIHGDSFVSESIRDYHLVDYIKDSQDEIVGYISSASGSFLSIVGRVFTSFAALVTIAALTFFMLVEGPRWIGSVWHFVPSRRREHMQRLATKMYGAVTGYVSGSLLIGFIAATLAAITMTIVGVPYAIALGIVVGLLGLIPMVGATIAGAVVVSVALFTSVPAAVIMLIYFFIYQQLENHILQPIVQGRTVQMSPLLVLVSVLIGVGVAGLLGAIVAIPIGASVQILVRDFIEHRQKQASA